MRYLPSVNYLNRQKLVDSLMSQHIYSLTILPTIHCEFRQLRGSLYSPTISNISSQTIGSDTFVDWMSRSIQCIQSELVQCEQSNHSNTNIALYIEPQGQCKLVYSQRVALHCIESRQIIASMKEPVLSINETNLIVIIECNHQALFGDGGQKE